ncbi:AAA family ATPase [Crossiella sp. CA-258035]|uniref:ATP-binding protein n=1 Tax=Crossiella sp. CA-258035 TaxID=2981138 RepID=UPI0024BC383C|nr:AAA family ATPase [Crossiella sp. CA-258035]WHT22331.1 AAA family ATPase [Crossiella sp. CA-258035]
MRTLLGRELPVAELAEALARAEAGQGGLVLLTGEAGIGKTSLAEHVTGTAAARGFRTRWGSSGGPAFWPWIQVLRQHHAELGTGGEHPWLRPLPVAPRPAEHARFRLFDDLAGLLTADRAPTLVVLDDLHWADEGTVRCLEFLAPQLRSAPLLVVGTCWEAPEGELARLGERIELTGLDAAATGSLLNQVTGTAPEPELLAAVHQRCGGNPFLATELARLLRHTAAPVALTAVPAGVRQVTALRLAVLPADAVDLLCQAAVLGLTVDLRELAQMAGLSTSETWSRLAEPLRHGLVAHQAEHLLRFPHSLLQEAVADRIPAPERAALHRRAATAIAACARADEASSRLAEHLTLGERGDEAAVHRVRAGRAAFRALAYEDAAVSFQQALDLLGDDDRDRVRRARILLALAEARFHSGALPAAVSGYEQAFDVARAVGDGETAARAALGCCVGNQLALHEPQLLRRLELALDGLPPGDGELRARVLARLAKELDPAETSRERRGLVAGQALAMARRLCGPDQPGDPATLAEVLSAHHQAMWSPHNARERLVVAAEAAAAAERAGADLLAMEAHMWCLVANLDLGERNAVEESLATTGRLAERLRHPLWLYYQRVCAATIRHADGDFAEAESLTRQALTHGRQANHPLAEASFHHHLARLALDRGDLPTAEAATTAYTDLISAVPQLSPALRCVTVWLRARLGHHLEARAQLDRLLADGAKPLAETTVGVPVVLLLAEVAHLTRAEEHAATLTEALRPYAGLVATSAGNPFGLISHALANLAALQDRPEEAESHFQSTVDQARRMGARPWLATARTDYAEFLLSHNNPQSHEQARQAEQEATALGMPTLAARAQALHDHH